MDLLRPEKRPKPKCWPNISLICLWFVLTLLASSPPISSFLRLKKAKIEPGTLIRKEIEAESEEGKMARPFKNSGKSLPP